MADRQVQPGCDRTLGEFVEALAAIEAHAVPDTHAVDQLCDEYPRILAGIRMHDGSSDRRRASGSYYTPNALVQAVLHRLDGRLRWLHENLRATVNIIDPSCGTGHFLAALAERTVADQAGNPAWDADSHRPQVALYGIDLDPLAARLCRLRLRRFPSVEVHIAVEDALIVDWKTRFPEVFTRDGGFDLIIGNPPWIAHAGRAAQRLPEARKEYLRGSFSSFAGYPTTHAVFVEQAVRHLKLDGTLALVLPASVAELEGYAPMRLAHDRYCKLICDLPDFGEHQFPGVTQPSLALLSQRTEGGRTDAPLGFRWPVERADLDETAKRLLRRLNELPKLPAALFGERGLQSNRESSRGLRSTPSPEDMFTLPIREGSDVTEYRLHPPRRHADPSVFSHQAIARDRFRSVGVVIRQTARFPIAAAHDGEVFRNSLLAGFPSEPWSLELLLGLLNSWTLRWYHFMQFREARQPVLPQVKISHLRNLPRPPDLSSSERAAIEATVTNWVRKNEAPDAEQRMSLERRIANVFGLLPEEWERVHRFAQR